MYSNLTQRHWRVSDVKSIVECSRPLGDRKCWSDSWMFNPPFWIDSARCNKVQISIQWTSFRKLFRVRCSKNLPRSSAWLKHLCSFKCHLMSYIYIFWFSVQARLIQNDARKMFGLASWIAFKLCLINFEIAGRFLYEKYSGLQSLTQTNLDMCSKKRNVRVYVLQSDATSLTRFGR